MGILGNRNAGHWTPKSYLPPLHTVPEAMEKAEESPFSNEEEEEEDEEEAEEEVPLGSDLEQVSGRKPAVYSVEPGSICQAFSTPLHRSANSLHPPLGMPSYPV